MNNTFSNKISKAKAKLLVNYPFFGTIASRLELVLNDDIQAFSSNGIKLEYSSDFLQNVTLDELEFVFANGAMHASLSHQNRKSNRSGWLWQLSTDYAINDVLVQNGLIRPYQAHYSKRFEGMYAEEIYADLKADILRDELEYDADNADDVEQNNHEQKKEQSKELSEDDTLEEQLFEQFSQSILQEEQKAQALPQSMERFFNLDLFSRIDWRNELRDAIDRFAKDDYAQIPPNKKFLHMGIYLPSTTSQTFKLVVAIDSSGSIDEKQLEIFMSELNSLMLSIPKYQIDLIICDDKIRSHKVFYNGNTLEYSIEGGGTTDFNPVFELIQKELFDTELLLYFTDLEGTFPKSIPSFDVKWVASEIKEIPFGTIIQI